MSAYKRSGWIPIEEGKPPIDKYLLLSFSNAPVPCIGSYMQTEEGWRFCDELDKPFSYGLEVNAWMPLPERYKSKE